MNSPGAHFNHVLLNRYRDGRDNMGLHADDEPELGPDPVVATLSLGATRRLTLVPRRPGDGERRLSSCRPAACWSCAAPASGGSATASRASRA